MPEALKPAVRSETFPFASSNMLLQFQHSEVQGALAVTALCACSVAACMPEALKSEVRHLCGFTLPYAVIAPACDLQAEAKRALGCCG